MTADTVIEISNVWKIFGANPGAALQAIRERGLTKAEIDAIAEHEHLPEMLAMEYGHYLIRQEDGALRVKAILADDLLHAEARGDTVHAAELRKVLRHFIAVHVNAASI